MAEQFSNAPAPSREEFEALAEQIGNIQKFVKYNNVAVAFSSGLAEISNSAVKSSSSVFITRNQQSLSNVIFSGLCASGKIKLSAYDTNTKTGITQTTYLDILVAI